MLKRIADYLLNEKKWWEENINGVVFYDIDNNYHEKIIHHFRFSTLKKESKYIDKSWEQCLQDMHNEIPTFKIKVHNGDTSEIIYLKTLKHFANEVPITENKSVYTNDTEIVSLTPMNTTPNFNINNISEIDISSSHINNTCSISSAADSFSIPASGTPSQSNNILVDKILSATLVSKKNTPPGHTRNIKGVEDVVSIRKKVSFENEKNKNQTLSGLSETSRRLLQIFGENEIVFEFDKCRKNIKAEKNSIYIQEYKKIVAKIEVKLVTK